MSNSKKLEYRWVPEGIDKEVQYVYDQRKSQQIVKSV